MFKSIKAKLMAVIILMVLGLLSLSSWLSYNQAHDILEEQILSGAEKEAKLNAEVIETRLSELAKQLQSLALAPGLIEMDWSEQSAILKTALTVHEDFEDLFIIDSTGAARTTAGEELDLADREYFHRLISSGKIVYSQLLKSRINDEMVVVIAAPIINAGDTRPIAAVAATVDLHYLKEIVTSMKVGGYGNGWIIDGQMRTVAHPEERYWGNTQVLEEGNDQLRQLARRMVDGENGSDFYELNGTEKIMAFAPVAATGWSVSLTAEMGQIMAPVYAMRKTSLIIAIIAVLVGIAVAIVVARAMAQPVVMVKEVAQSLADGDLTRSIEYSSSDEIGAMAEAMDQAMANLRRLVGQVVETSDQMAASSQELASSAEEVGQASGQVAETINQLAKAADQQAKDSQEMSQVIEGMTQSVKQVALAAQRMADDAGHAVSAAQDGQDLVEKTIAQMNTIRDTVAQTAVAVDGLGERSQQVGSIVEMITTISDQTNLLALNAAIEAARAGEQGRGFAVVAEEVRKLAEQSRDAAKQIAGLIQEIQEETSGAVQAMKQGTSEVAVGVESVAGTGRAFEAIARAVQTMGSQIREVNNAAQELSAGSEQFVKSVESIAAIAQETAAATEEVSASSEEQSASAQQIAASAESLATLSEELQKAVGTFKIS